MRLVKAAAFVLLAALLGVGYGTVNVTKSGSDGLAAPQVVENDGRPERTRTVDLYRVKLT